MFIPFWFNEAYVSVRRHALAFLAIFFGVVFVTYFVLFTVDFIPEPVMTEGVEETEVLPEVEETELEPVAAVVPTAALPTTITLDRLNRTVTVLNPETSDITTLDAALLKGVVHHPDSADFDNTGNIFILGHSSHLPNVFNKNFQAFNGLETMTWGDKIHVASADTEYTYRVEKVYEAKASEVVVPHTPGEARLTLATCDNFGSKDDRFIVEAVLVSQTTL